MPKHKVKMGFTIGQKVQKNRTKHGLKHMPNMGLKLDHK